MNLFCKEFDSIVPQHLIDIEEKNKSNNFSWRGQFSPQLIKTLFKYYCPENSVVLDPFLGSGTVLYESGCCGLRAYGFDINPSAFILSSLYKFINFELFDRKEVIKSFYNKIIDRFENNYFTYDYKFDYKFNNAEKIIFNVIVLLLNSKNKVTKEIFYKNCYNVFKLIMKLPYSKNPVIPYLGDARQLILKDNYVDFVITSPPYINVFNYHQNYRKSVELLGWDVLKTAKYEIGSNRANRSNRFITVIQYCIDMGKALNEIKRVCKDTSKVIFIVGCESKILGTSFFNSDIIYEIATKSEIFNLVLKQTRKFKNRFGLIIKEDILNFSNSNLYITDNKLESVSKKIAYKVLCNALETVPKSNRKCLKSAIDSIQKINGTPIYKPVNDDNNFNDSII